jgi:hypothetical protein
MPDYRCLASTCYFFDKSDTENYVSHMIEDKHSVEAYLITMHRIRGFGPKTPIKGETPLDKLLIRKKLKS